LGVEFGGLIGDGPAGGGGLDLHQAVPGVVGSRTSNAPTQSAPHPICQNLPLPSYGRRGAGRYVLDGRLEDVRLAGTNEDDRVRKMLVDLSSRLFEFLGRYVNGYDLPSA